MKPLTLTALIIASVLPNLATANPSTRAQIAEKEAAVAKLQQEIASLKKQLSVQNAGDYTVRTGDTLSSIARRHKTSVKSLIDLNGLDSEGRIVIGQKLKINGSSPPKSTPAPLAGKTGSYTVQRGDTFYNIARRHKMSVSDLKSYNPGINPDRIVVGQSLATKAGVKPTPSSTQTASTKKKISPPRSTTSSSKPKNSSTSSKPKTTTISSTSTKKSTPPTSKSTGTTRKISSRPPLDADLPPAPPEIKEEPVTKPSTVTSIILTEETTFSDFASKHKTSTDQLNALNGWNLPKSTLLARGSEVYVPK